MADRRPWSWKLRSVITVTELRLVSQRGASRHPFREWWLIPREPSTPEGRRPPGFCLAGPPVAGGAQPCPKGRQGCPGRPSPELLWRSWESRRPSRFQAIAALVSPRQGASGKLRTPSAPQGAEQLGWRPRREMGTQGSDTSGQPGSLHCPVGLSLPRREAGWGAASNPSGDLRNLPRDPLLFRRMVGSFDDRGWGRWGRQHLLLGRSPLQLGGELLQGPLQLLAGGKPTGPSLGERAAPRGVIREGVGGLLLQSAGDPALSASWGSADLGSSVSSIPTCCVTRCLIPAPALTACRGRD